MHWRRKWQPTPVFLPGESQGRQSLVGCRLWGPHRVGHDWSDLAAVAAAALSPQSSSLLPLEQGRFPRWDKGESSFRSKAKGSLSFNFQPGILPLGFPEGCRLIINPADEGDIPVRVAAAGIPLAQPDSQDPHLQRWTRSLRRLEAGSGYPGNPGARGEAEARRTPGRGSGSSAQEILKDPLPAGSPAPSQRPNSTSWDRPAGLFAMGKKGIWRMQAKQQCGCPISESQAGIRKVEEIGATIKQTNKQTNPEQ